MEDAPSQAARHRRVADPSRVERPTVVPRSATKQSSLAQTRARARRTVSDQKRETLERCFLTNFLSRLSVPGPLLGLSREHADRAYDTETPTDNPCARLQKLRTAHKQSLNSGRGTLAPGLDQTKKTPAQRFALNPFKARAEHLCCMCRILTMRLRPPQARLRPPRAAGAAQAPTPPLSRCTSSTRKGGPRESPRCRTDTSTSRTCPRGPETRLRRTRSPSPSPRRSCPRRRRSRQPPRNPRG